MKNKTVRNNVPTFQVEILGFKNEGRSNAPEETKWEPYSVVTRLDKVKTIMEESDYYMRVLHNGEVIAQNFSKIEMG